MKKFKLSSIILLVAFMMSIVSCSKSNENGPAVNSEIKGSVSYKNSDGTTFSTVSPIIHVAYNATSATTNYDLTVVGKTDGTYSIKGLGIGDYFVTAEYTNATSGLHYIAAGAKVHLGNTKDAVTADFVLQ